MLRHALLWTLTAVALVVLIVAGVRSLAGDGPRAPRVAPARVPFALQLPSTQPAAAPADIPPHQPDPAPMREAPRAVSPPPTAAPTVRQWTQPAPAARPTTDAEPPPPATTAPADDVRARRADVARLGGTARSENAVEIGLAWLAAHQQPDGTWSRTRFPMRCPPDDRCTGIAVVRTEASLHVGLTGLCTLAFLGAGYTDRDGPYQDNVARAIAALLRAQLPHGGFGTSEKMAGYNDALATFALAEAYAQTRDAALRDPLERAVRRIAVAQQELGGWDYLPRPTTGRNDTSITAWMIQALQAADASDIEVPKAALVRATLHFARATEADGRVWYSDSGNGFELSDRMRPVYRYGPAMTAAGLLSRQLLGMRHDSPLAQRQTALLLADLPSEGALLRDSTGLHSHYYWYYGTVALFQRGGPAWERWNAAVRDTLLPLQDRGVGEKRGHSYGSWAPFAAKWGKWGRMGGRVYTTALCVLTLETYYRHVPAYLNDDQALRPGDWLAVLPDLSERERLWAVDALAESRLEQGEPVLVAMLRDDVPRVAVRAAIALADLDSPAGAGVLQRHAATITTRTQQDLMRARRQIAALRSRPAGVGTLRVFDADRDLATIELPGTWLGQEVLVERDGETIARLEVVQRFSGQPVSVARVLSVGSQPPGGGESVRAAAEGARP